MCFNCSLSPSSLCASSAQWWAFLPMVSCVCALMSSSVFISILFTTLQGSIFISRRKPSCSTMAHKHVFPDWDSLVSSLVSSLALFPLWPSHLKNSDYIGSNLGSTNYCMCLLEQLTEASWALVPHQWDGVIQNVLRGLLWAVTWIHAGESLENALLSDN